MVAGLEHGVPSRFGVLDPERGRPRRRAPQGGLSAWILRGIPLLLATTNLSCDIVKPKDRFINDQAKRPTIGPIESNTLRPGQHLAGVVNLELDPASLAGLSGPVIVSAALDDSVVQTDHEAPYQFQINTADSAVVQGDHTISFQVFESQPSSGLYGFVGLPSVVLSTNVVFDQTPPTPVTLNSVVWDSNAPLLTWTANSDENFYAYEVSRTGNWGTPLNPPYLLPAGPIVPDQGTLSYRDTALGPPVIGVTVDYRLHVINRAEAASSNVVKLQYGEAVPGLAADRFTTYRFAPPVPSPTTDEFYVSIHDTLRAYSTLTHTEARRIPLQSRSFAVTQDGTQILAIFHDYVHGTDYLQIYAASTFALSATLAMGTNVGSNDYVLVAGRPDRAYITSYNGLYVVNVDTGTTLGPYPLFRYILPYDEKLAISPDANTLFTSTPDSVYRIDVSTDVVQIVGRRATSQRIADLQLSPDGQRLYLGHFYVAPSNTVEILDTVSLVTIGQLAGPPDEQLSGFLVTANYLYLAHSRADAHGLFYLPGRVEQYNRTSLVQLRFWDFVQASRWLVSSRDEQWLYAEGFETWVVPALSPSPSLARK